MTQHNLKNVYYNVKWKHTTNFCLYSDYVKVSVKVKSLSHVRLCDLTDCSLPGSSIHEIFQVRILEWVAISFSRRSSQPRDWTWVSRIVGRHFTVWANQGKVSVCVPKKVELWIQLMLGYIGLVDNFLFLDSFLLW